jgi:hypothetical protein
MFITVNLDAFGAEWQQTLLIFAEVCYFLIRMEGTGSCVVHRRVGIWGI